MRIRDAGTTTNRCTEAVNAYLFGWSRQRVAQGSIFYFAPIFGESRAIVDSVISTVILLQLRLTVFRW